MTETRHVRTPTVVPSDNVRLVEGESAVVDLAAVPLHGPSGVLWGLDSPQLNVNFVTIRPGESIAEHVNAQVDVLMIVVSGSGQVLIDGHATQLKSDCVALIPRHTPRSIHSDSGMVYYSIHTRRSGLQVGAQR